MYLESYNATTSIVRNYKPSLLYNDEYQMIFIINKKDIQKSKHDIFLADTQVKVICDNNEVNGHLVDDVRLSRNRDTVSVTVTKKDSKIISKEQERDEYINDLFYTHTKLSMLVVKSTTLKIAMDNAYNVNKQHQSSVDHVLRLLDELKQPLDQIAKQLKAKYI